jgi:hypothetical protein
MVVSFQTDKTNMKMLLVIAKLLTVVVNSESRNGLRRTHDLDSCIEIARAREAAGSVAEAFGAMQDCLFHYQPTDSEKNTSSAISLLRGYAVLQNELARQATNLLAYKQAITYFDGAVSSFQELFLFESSETNEYQLQGLQFRGLCLKPALYMIGVTFIVLLSAHALF